MFLAKGAPSDNSGHLCTTPFAAARPIDIAIESASISNLDSYVVFHNHIFGESTSAFTALVSLSEGLFAWIEALVTILADFGWFDSKIRDLERERHD